MFYGCSGLTSISIPNTVTSIGKNAFGGCSKVESLYISSAIETIGEYAFAGCTSISEIQMASKKAITASANIFSNETYNNATLYVPVGSKSDFEKVIPWRIFYIQEKDYAGIEDIVADDNGDEQIKYFNLNGVRVENPQNGIFIRRQGNKVEKVIVK